jgi:UDP-GlcNAc3NAcA epimerase
MIKIITVVGARPQFIKAAAISRIISREYANTVQEIMVHTGQHYDVSLSKIFFDELQIPPPKYQLNIGSLSNTEQLAAMLPHLEKILLAEQAHAVLVYGDTNSTLAASIAAANAGVPLVHVEAGLRSFNKTMPEERNRIICDMLSTLLFTPTDAGYTNLRQEGLTDNEKRKVYRCGDVMLDNALYYAQQLNANNLDTWHLKPQEFVLLTLHRAENTDDAQRLTHILQSINQLSIEHQMPVLWPIHPRTLKMLNTQTHQILYKSLCENNYVKIIEPVSYLQMLLLEKYARFVMTDSGGVQKETSFFNKESMVLRNQTEWTELVTVGAAHLVGADAEKIKQCFVQLLKSKPKEYGNLYGDGHAAAFIIAQITKYFATI